MTLSPADLALYCGALLILFLTPGPVWLAIMARSLSGGFQAAWPLALGVAVGDAVWPLLAILGVSWVVAGAGWLMGALKWVAAGVFLLMGILILKNAGKSLSSDSRLNRPGMWAGFLAGLAAILGNPKAILFYMGVLPGFFDLTRVTGTDIIAVVVASMAVPLVGNLAFAGFIDRARRLLTSPRALRRMNISAGLMLILVGLVIPIT